MSIPGTSRREAAGVNHFSLFKRLSAFGILAWFMLPVVVILLPFKLITASRANRRMDECFQSLAFRLRPIAPGSVFGRIRLHATRFGHQGRARLLHAMGRTSVQVERAVEDGDARPPEALDPVLPAVEFPFSIPVPGIAADHLRAISRLCWPAIS